MGRMPWKDSLCCGFLMVGSVGCMYSMSSFPTKYVLGEKVQSSDKGNLVPDYIWSWYCSSYGHKAQCDRVYIWNSVGFIYRTYANFFRKNRKSMGLRASSFSIANRHLSYVN